MSEAGSGSALRPQTSNGWRAYFAPLASLKITVTLLALSMVLVFAGTWAQVDQGIWFVQKEYFHSVFTWVSFALFLPRNWNVPGGFPMSGGYLLGLLLLINLFSAYIARFRFTWRDLILLPAVGLSIFLGWLVLGDPTVSQAIVDKMGWEKGGVYYLLLIFVPLVLLPTLAAVLPLHAKRSWVILIHLGVLLLLVGEGVTSRVQHEAQMFLDEGKVVNFAEDLRNVELAITDPTPADHDDAVLVSQRRLAQGGTIHWPSLPFDIRIDQFFPNSQVLGPMQAQQAKIQSRATQGQGAKLAVVGIPPFTGTEAQNVDQPSAYITLLSRDGQDLGTWLVTTYLDLPQQFTLDGHPYSINLRFARDYKPYSLELQRFAHDKYTGTDVAKNFASHVHLVDPANHVDRDVLIRMNEPLRYNGETFYQSSFKPGDKTSILQVVRNPGWLMPYVACTIGAAGLIGHFGLTLLNFLRKRQKQLPLARLAERERLSWSNPAFVVPLLVFVVFGSYVLSRTRAPGPVSDYDLDRFSRLPLSYEGRTLPMDSLARNSLKVIAGRESISLDGKRKEPVEWLLDVMARPEDAVKQKVFRIDNHEVLALMHLEDKDKFYSESEMEPHLGDLEREINRAQQVDSKKRDTFDRKVLQLGEQVMLFRRLSQLESLYVIPPARAGEDWKPLGEAMAAAKNPQDLNPAAVRFVSMLQGYHEKKPDDFDTEAAAYGELLSQHVPKASDKASFETWFNRFDPFMQCMVLYVVVFLLSAAAWLVWPRPLSRAALWLLALTILVHTLGLFARIYISGRPPVTNLASSAIFIAWAGVLMAAGLELVYRNGIGAVAAAVMGFGSLLISDRLSLSGDTMQVLQAVLDTNFWLATHVVTITLGYAATFLAGLLAVLYVVRGLLTPSMTRDDAKSHARMVYGIVCFAMLFSFVGTILGGIWADQSWGRFWGWDPKENGAVLIVLWNAIILHARWGGLVKERGLMLLAIFGNVVTAWSWFGTNMLGVGLHSYGFMEGAMFVLVAFVASQLALILLGSIPLRFWRSFSSPAPT